MKYCKYCGAQIEDDATCTCSNSQKKGNLQKKSPKFIGIVIGTVVAVIMVILLIVGGMKNDITQFVDVSFEGINGKGSVEFDYNIGPLCESTIGQEPAELSEEWLDWDEQYTELMNGIDYSISKEENLSNGEEITIEFKFTGLAAEYFKDDIVVVEVTGLKELEKVDVFKNVAVTYAGVNGDGYVTEVFVQTSDEFLNALDYSVSDAFVNEGLSNGDSVEIVVKCEDWIAEEYAQVPEKTTKTVTVSGLPQAMVASDITKQDLDDIYAYVETDLSEDSFYDYKDVKFNSVYLFTVKDEYKDSAPQPSFNKLVVYYTAKLYDKDGSFINDVYVHAEIDGDYIFNEHNYNGLVHFEDQNSIIPEKASVYYSEESFEDILDDACKFYFKDAYTYEKVDI